MSILWENPTIKRKFAGAVQSEIPFIYAYRDSILVESHKHFEKYNKSCSLRCRAEHDAHMPTENNCIENSITVPSDEMTTATVENDKNVTNNKVADKSVITFRSYIRNIRSNRCKSIRFAYSLLKMLIKFWIIS